MTENKINRRPRKFSIEQKRTYYMHGKIQTLKLLAAMVEKNGLLIFTSSEEYGEIWSDNGGHDLYHASLSSAEYTEILSRCHFEILVHKVRDPDCGEATVWVAKKK